MAPSRCGAVAFAIGAFGLFACSVEDDGLRRELERGGPMTSSAGRPPIILSGADAAPGGPTPGIDPAPIPPDAAPAIDAPGAIDAPPPPPGDGGAR